MTKTQVQKEEKVSSLLEKVKKLESKFIAEMSDSKLETQKKSRALRNIKKEIARVKTLISKKIYEKAQDE
jgi:ribosomal protein L29